MRLMLCGPHNIGKSQTCEKLTEILSGFKYVESPVSNIAKEMGYNLNANPAPKQVIDFQWRVLKEFEQLYLENSRNTIFDRSPLDLIGYMTLALRDKPEYDLDLLNYCLAALADTEKYCDILVYPEADLTAPIEDKYNRPTDLQAREDLAANIYYNFRYVVRSRKKIYVPETEQYERRVKFIVKELGELK